MTKPTPSDSDFRPVPGWGPPSDGRAYQEVSDVAVDAADTVYVLTRGPARILAYSSKGVLLRHWGEGTLGQRPHGITVGPDGTVYCVDEFDHAVHLYTRDGTHLRDIGTRGVASDTGVDYTITDLYDRTASIVRAAGPFNHPAALAVAPNGDLYVADGYGNARVHRFDPDGKLRQSWGEPGTGLGQFHIPHGICVDPGDERVLVADRENERIQVFTPDGRYLESWTGLQRPAALTFGPDMLIYVAELGRSVSHRSWTRPPAPHWQPSRLSVLDRQGRPISQIGAGQDPCAPGIMAAAHGIAVDSFGDIYVAEITRTSLLGRPDAVDGRPVPPTCHTFQKLARRDRAATRPARLADGHVSSRSPGNVDGGERIAGRAVYAD
jgi:sugar lactone lactonase YvrE